ncbi:MAG: DUF2442 domain-containing protein [Candidatus Cyclobacteriaceae bacterium M2_1C_046]
MSSLENKYDPIEKLIFIEGLKIKTIHFHQDLDLMIIVLSNGKIMKIRLSVFSGLKNATEEQLMDFRLIGKGVGVHWPQLDEDLSLKRFLQEELIKVSAA